MENPGVLDILVISAICTERVMKRKLRNVRGSRIIIDKQTTVITIISLEAIWRGSSLSLGVINEEAGAARVPAVSAAGFESRIPTRLPDTGVSWCLLVSFGVSWALLAPLPRRFFPAVACSIL